MTVERADRLVSLDAFRGFTIASMVLVNNPGDWNHIYRQLGHAEWHGWTFTDWVFPFFLFIVGVSMCLSLSKRTVAANARGTLVVQLWKRGAIIFLIGFALNLIPSFEFTSVRIPGVLQRIGLCVIAAAPIAIYCSWRQQMIWIVALFAVYSIVMLLVPVPDLRGRVAAGVLEPGRDFGAYVDRLLMDGHLWAKAKTWDPEGAVSTLPAIASVLFGVLAGRWLAARQTPAEKTVWMLLAGLLCLSIGAALDVVLMPLNKNLWTVSFSVFMTGWALLLFAAFYWLIDGNPADVWRKRARRWLAPFTIYGMNALFIFVLSSLVAKMLMFVQVTRSDGTLVPLKTVLYAPIQGLPLAPVNASLLFALIFNMLMLGVAYAMWRKRWFVKI